jgi:hypothetical protein
MATGTARTMNCTPDDVFATLADGWLYPTWVVGAARMRDVSPEWPEAGAKIHHSLGIWPILLNDESEVVEWSPPTRMRIRAKAGPFGRAVVVLEVRPRPDGCVVRVGEEPVTGPARVIPAFFWAPFLRARNREILRRLAAIAEGRRRERLAGEQTAREDTPPDDGGTAGAGARADARAATGASEAARTGRDADSDADEPESPAGERAGEAGTHST